MSQRGAYKKSEASRKQVLDAALRELSERGYARTSVSDIAAAAGMSKGAVHYHFDSKDDLIEQVLARCFETMSEKLREAWEVPGTAEERVCRTLRSMRAMRRAGVVELRVLADLMAQGIHDQRLQRPIAAMLQLSRKQIVEHLIVSLKQLGLEPKVPADAMARLLLGTLDGLALHALFDPSTDAESEETERVLEGIVLSLFER
jgi:AcrR family transcriptional regulator